MKRRTFLKMLGAAPVAVAIPKIAATEELKPAYFKGTEFYFKPEHTNAGGSVNFISEPFTNELSGIHKIPPRPLKEVSIAAETVTSEPMLEAWANITGVCRKPNEMDEQLRIRILNKLERNDV